MISEVQINSYTNASQTFLSVYLWKVGYIWWTDRVCCIKIRKSAVFKMAELITNILKGIEFLPQMPIL